MNHEQAELVVESVEGGKSLCMRGIFIQGDRKNHNRRVYPLHEIRNAVESMRRKLAEGSSIMGELDHPAELTINLDRVSHIITDIWLDGANGYGKLKLLPTPMGNIARSLIESSVKLGVSSRGSGNVDDYGNVSGFDIVTVDIVAQPSAPEAYPKPIYESLFNMKGGASIYETASAVTYDVSAKQHLDKSILRFINELKL